MMLADRGTDANQADRWANDLQDGTLQGLAAMKVFLKTAGTMGPRNLSSGPLRHA